MDELINCLKFYEVLIVLMRSICILLNFFVFVNFNYIWKVLHNSSTGYRIVYQRVQTTKSNGGKFMQCLSSSVFDLSFHLFFLV